MDGGAQFAILGPVTVVRDGIPVPIGGRRRLSLLAIFLLRPNTELSASVLIDLLWSGSPPARAANTLQVHVSQLRRALGGDADGTGERLLVTRPSGYALQVERDRIDALVFEDLLASGRASMEDADPAAAWRDLDAALSLWRGRALGDLAGDEFAVVDAERLEELRLQAVHARAEAVLALGRHRELVADLEPLVAEHPLREELTAQLMLALYRGGRQADALAAYQRTRHALVEALGLEPDPELQRLEDAILLQKTELDWHPPAARAVAVLRVTAPTVARTLSPLVGRRRERAALDGAWRDSLGGDGQALLLAGEPGIGKTRLANEIWQRAAADGATVLHGQCTQSVVLPYQAIVEALTPLVVGSDPEAVADRLGPLYRSLTVLLPRAGPLAVRSDPGDRYLQFEAAVALLREAADDAPVLLVVEDLHWADDPTLLLLEHLVRGVAGARILVVGTFRDTDLGAGHTLADPDSALARSSTTLMLDGLDGDEVGELVHAWTGSAAEADVARALRDRTNGNPMFVEELLRHLGHHAGGGDSTGELERELDTAAPVDEQAVATAVPSGIRAMISRRVGLLDATTRHVLAVAAVVGVEFDVGLVAEVASVSIDVLADALEEARGARITVDLADGRAAFAHALMAESVLADLGATRRAATHGAVARALEVRFGRDPAARAGELADHFARAGDPDSQALAWRYSRDAARHATAVLAPEEAVRRYTEALRLLDLAPDGAAADRCELALELGEAAFHAGDRALSRQAFASAVDVASATGDPDRLARVALGISGWGLQDLWVDYGLVNDATVGLLERALAGGGALDSPLRARLLSRLAEEIYFSPHEQRRFDLADDAVLMARRLDDPAVLAHTLHGRMRTREGPDTLTERLADAREMLVAADRSGRRDVRCVAHGRMVPTLMEAARFDDADRHLAAHAQLADDLRSPLHRIWSCGMRAARSLMSGDFARVEALLGEAAAISPEQFAVVQAFAGMLCVLRVEQGRAEEMVDVARQFVAEFEHVPAWRAGFAVLLAEAGAVAEARFEIDAVLGTGLGRVRRDQNWTFCMAALAEACARLDDATRAAPVYDELLPFDGRFVVLGDGYAVWCAVAKSLGILARAAGRFETARAHLEAALVAHRAAGADALTARTEVELATVLEALGLEREASELRVSASAAARRMGQAGLLQKLV
jgi:DNA-binding SARP family transcriptional activator